MSIDEKVDETDIENISDTSPSGVVSVDSNSTNNITNSTKRSPNSYYCHPNEPIFKGIKEYPPMFTFWQVFFSNLMKRVFYF
jgi:hypothetical protein